MNTHNASLPYLVQSDTERQARHVLRILRRRWYLARLEADAARWVRS